MFVGASIFVLTLWKMKTSKIRWKFMRISEIRTYIFVARQVARYHYPARVSRYPARVSRYYMAAKYHHILMKSTNKW